MLAKERFDLFEIPRHSKSKNRMKMTIGKALLSVFLLLTVPSEGQNSYKAIPKLGDVVTPEMFGAKGDGLSDDRIALQAALDAKQAIISLSGNYKISGSLNIPSNKKIFGQQSIISAQNGKFFDALVIKGGKNIYIDGLTIQAKDAENAFDKAIYIIDGKNIVISNCIINNIGKASNVSESGFGILVSGSKKSAPTGNFGSENVKILNNTITNIKGFGMARGDFICIQYASQVLIENNYLNNCSRQGIAITDFATDIKISNNFILNSSLAGIDIEPDYEKTITAHITIRNNTIRNFGCKPKLAAGVQLFGIDCHGNQSDIDIEGNQIIAENDSSIAGINCQADSYNIRISNNLIEGNNILKKGILLYSGSGAKNLIISGNIIRGFKDYGIDSYQNGSMTIIGNQIESSIALTGIKANETDAIISNNIITISNNDKNVCGISVLQSGFKKLHNNVVKVRNGKAYQIMVNSEFQSIGSHFSDNSAINLGNGMIAYAIEAGTLTPGFLFVNNYSDPSFLKSTVPEAFSITSVNGTSPPSSGYHVKGSRVRNVNPSAKSYLGWICIDSGTPGIWKPFGSILPD